MVRRSLTASRRRKLPWLAALALLAAVIAVLAIRYPNTAKREPPAAVSNQPVSVDVQSPSVPLTGARKQAATAVARAFLVDAVLRVDSDAAWALVTPSLRRGTVRADWRAGNIPVVPYDQKVLLKAKWKLWYSYADRVGFEVGLIPKPGKTERRAEFTLELNEVGRGSHGHWLVSSWLPAPTLTPLPPAPVAGTSELAFPAPRGRLNAAWLVIPLGLLVLVVVVPIWIGTREWRRGVRAARAYRSGSAGR